MRAPQCFAEPVLAFVAGCATAACSTFGERLSPEQLDRLHEWEAGCRDECRERALEAGAPVAVKRVLPDYPRDAEELAVSGCTLVSFEITPEGRAEKYRILDSQPPGVFDAATLEALDQWRFEPPSRPGRYAQRLEYWIEPRSPVDLDPHRHRPKEEPVAMAAHCMATPGFDELNGPFHLRDTARRTELVNLSGVIPRRRVPPIYPREAARKGVQGCVVVSFEITPDGTADKYRIVESQPPGVFDLVTIEALSRWRFEVPPWPGRHMHQIDYFIDGSRDPKPECTKSDKSDQARR